MVLRVVIDSNRLQSDELKCFLEVEQTNRAVLTDYAWMEAYKHPDPVTSIRKSMSVLRQFPDQVIVLKGTKEVGALDARAPGIAARMVVRERQAFHETVRGLQSLEAGDRSVELAILGHARAAVIQMEKVLRDMENLAEPMISMASVFNKQEMALMRRRLTATPEMIHKIMGLADELFWRLIRAHPQEPRRPTLKSKVNTFLYRYALATVLFLVDWIEGGSQTNRAAKKFRNDLVDLNFAVYGTYFNGLMTEDRRALRAYVFIARMLEELGARVPPYYLDEHIGQVEAIATS